MPKINSSKEEKRRRHIAEMGERLERHFGHRTSPVVAPDDNSESAERFLEQILAMEGVDQIPLFDVLASKGISMPPARELDDAQVSAKLWEVIREMALFGHYLTSTDHLSDRELYELLWNETLRDPTSILPSDPYFCCHIDLLGGWSEEDTQIYLKYYAEQEERERWSEEWPEIPIPPHEDPPYDRDRHLPEPQYGINDVRETS